MALFSTKERLEKDLKKSLVKIDIQTRVNSLYLLKIIFLYGNIHFRKQFNY